MVVAVEVVSSAAVSKSANLNNVLLFNSFVQAVVPRRMALVTVESLVAVSRSDMADLFQPVFISSGSSSDSSANKGMGIFSREYIIS